MRTDVLAATPVGGHTARVLVTGATGGVGRMAVQLAYLAGAQVTALARDPAASAQVLRRLGATVVTAELGGEFDVIVEGVGGATFGRAIEHLAPRGVLVNIATQEEAETVTAVAGPSTEVWSWADDSQGEDRADRCPYSGYSRAASSAGRRAKPSCLPPPSASRDQYVVKLASLIFAEESDLEPLTWEWLLYLGGLPELAGDADADGAPGVMGLLDDRCHRRHIGTGHGDYESVQGGLFRLAWWGPVGED